MSYLGNYVYNRNRSIKVKDQSLRFFRMSSIRGVNKSNKKASIVTFKMLLNFEAYGGSGIHMMFFEFLVKKY